MDGAGSLASSASTVILWQPWHLPSARRVDLCFGGSNGASVNCVCCMRVCFAGSMWQPLHCAIVTFLLFGPWQPLHSLCASAGTVRVSLTSAAWHAPQVVLIVSPRPTCLLCAKRAVN